MLRRRRSARRRASLVGALSLSVLLGAGGGARAAETADVAAPPTTVWRTGLEAIVAGGLLAPRDGGINPGNRVLALPTREVRLELRPTLRIRRGAWELVARPRLVAVRGRAARDGAADTTRHETQARWGELYGAWRASDALLVTYGLQNFQWGPGELLSPSNRIVHEVGLLKDPLFYTPGRHLARVNLALGQQGSLVVLGELAPNRELPFRFGERFARAGLAKAEWAAKGGASYLGLVAGARRHGRPWYGLYGTWAASDAWWIYADAAIERGSQAWYPRVRAASGGAAPSVPVFVRDLQDGRRWRPLALAGVRWNLASGAELRGELLVNDAGYRRAEIDAAAVALAAGGPPAAGPFFAPGLEFLGRRMLLVAARLPDLPPSRRTQLSLRLLHAPEDAAALLFATASVEAGEAWVGFASLAVARGRPTAELARLARASLSLGFVRTW